MKLSNRPKVSIISASYNHKKYSANFIKSVLNQTFTDFELIIIDDASSDNNLKIIKSFNDPRITIIQHPYNMGPSISINDGIAKSRGEYISFIATDDEVFPQYLEKGIKFLDKNKKYNALCFQLTAINENGNILVNKNLQQTLKFKNIEHYELLRQMFTIGNMIPSPGEIVRKSVFKKVGFFNPSLLQTQDYDFHVKTLLENKIYVYQKPLVKYRQSTNENNIDNHNSVSLLRQKLEMPFILNNFLNISIDLFSQVFKKEIKSIGKPIQNTIPYFLAIIAINTPDPIRQEWGYQTLITFIQSKGNLELLHSLYSVQYKDIILLTNKIITHPKTKIYFLKRIIKKLFKNN